MLSLGNNCPYISDDLNEDTISVLVRLITEKKGKKAAVTEVNQKLVVRVTSSLVALEGSKVSSKYVRDNVSTATESDCPLLIANLHG